MTTHSGTYSTGFEIRCSRLASRARRSAGSRSPKRRIRVRTDAASSTKCVRVFQRSSWDRSENCSLPSRLSTMPATSGDGSSVARTTSSRGKGSRTSSTIDPSDLAAAETSADRAIRSTRASATCCSRSASIIATRSGRCSSVWRERAAATVPTRSSWLERMSSAKAAGTMPIRMSMISPMPF